MIRWVNSFEIDRLFFDKGTNPTTMPPNFTFQKTTNNDFYNDTVAFNIFNMNSTHFNVSTKVSQYSSCEIIITDLHTATGCWTEFVRPPCESSYNLANPPRNSYPHVFSERVFVFEEKFHLCVDSIGTMIHLCSRLMPRKLCDSLAL